LKSGNCYNGNSNYLNLIAVIFNLFQLSKSFLQVAMLLEIYLKE
jgi:hypothetical protein